MSKRTFNIFLIYIVALLCYLVSLWVDQKLPEEEMVATANQFDAEDEMRIVSTYMLVTFVLKIVAIGLPVITTFLLVLRYFKGKED